MKKFIIILVMTLIICDTTILSNNFIKTVDFLSQFKKPVIKSFNFNEKDLIQSYTLKPYEIILTTDSRKPALFTIKRNNIVLLKQTASYSIWGIYLDKVIYFDIDQNGFQDLFFISYNVGVSGISANIPRIACFLFYKNDEIKYFEINSFFGSDNLFADYNNDGKYEFACTTLRTLYDSKYNESKYYVTNVFSLNETGITNITKTIKDFPLYSTDIDYKELVITNDVPEEIRKEAIFDCPDVYKYM